MSEQNASSTTSKSTSVLLTERAHKVAFALQKKLGGFVSAGRFPLAHERFGFYFSRDGINYEGFGQSYFEADVAGTARRIYDVWIAREKSAIHGKVRKNQFS